MSKANWPAIADRAISPDPFDRRLSIYQSVTELEKALRACGVKTKTKKQSVADAFISYMQSYSNLYRRIQRLFAPEIFASRLRHAITARNKGVHADNEIDRDHCEWYVEIIYIAWTLLRQTYVTQSRASDMAADLLSACTSSERRVPRSTGPYDKAHFSDVFLFGSLARAAEDPKDIDLLLVANDEYLVSFEVGYAGDTGEKEQQILTYLDQEMAPNTPGFATDQNKAAVECGWLNFTVVDRAFGTDRDATLRSSRVQSDPFFFLNLARDLMWFDRNNRRWTKSLANLSVFKELAKLQECLVDLGILSGHDLRQRSLSDREHKITLDRELYGLVEKVRLKYLDSLTVDSLDEVIPSRMTIILSALRDGLEIADGEGTVSFPA